MRKVIIGLMSLVLTGILCTPAAAWYHAGGWGGGHWQGNRSSWSAEGFRGTASGGTGPGALVVIVEAAHPVAMAPGAAPAIAAAQRPAERGRGMRQARKGGALLVGTDTGMGPAPMARRPMAGTIAITVEPMRRIIRRQR